MSVIWRQFAKRQQRIEKEFIPKMEGAIRGEVSKAVEKIKKEGVRANIDVFNSAGILTTLKALYHKAAVSEAVLSYRKNKNRVKLVGLGVNEAWNRAVETYLLQHNIFNTVEQINETTKKRVLQLISEGIQNGDSVDVIVNTIEADDIPLKRARLIVRTESVGAMNMGSMMGAISTGIMYQKKWVTAGDHRVRGTKPSDKFNHVILNGELVDMEKPFNNGQPIMFPGDKRASAGNFCNCFLPEELTSVNPKNIKKVFRSFYDGEVVTVKSSNGKSFTCTPNHPILTSKGWVNAGLLTKGSYLIHSDFIDNSVFPEFNIQDRPSTFEQIHSSLQEVGIVSNMPGTVMDFYGDGSASNVNIVEMDSLLTNRVKIRKRFKHKAFKKSNFRQISLSSKRSFDMSLIMLLNRVRTHGFVSLTNQQRSLQGVGVRHSIDHAFTSISRSDAQPIKPNNNSGSGAPVTFGKIFDAETGIIKGFKFVEGDNCSLVFECTHKKYSGFVYTFETIQQTYDINSFVAKNCRCCMSYVAKRDERGRIMRYPETIPDKPAMSVGADGKLSDLLFQVIIGQIFGQILANYESNN